MNKRTELKNSLLGTAAHWNDTVYPRMSLLEEKHGARWEFTEAEILSGLDGFFIAKHIREWLNQVRRMRLSQVVEMFYNSRGIPTRAIETSGHKSKTFGSMKEYVSILQELAEGISLDEDVNNACDRMKILDSIDIGRLQDETFNFAQVLQFTAISVYMTEDKLRSSCDHAVNTFISTAKRILAGQTTCNNIPKPTRVPVLDLKLSLDGSRYEYDNLQLLNHISKTSQVSSYGTNITVIHGTTGEIISNRSNSVVDTFEQIRNYTGRSEIFLLLLCKIYLTHLHSRSYNHKSLGHFPNGAQYPTYSNSQRDA